MARIAMAGGSCFKWVFRAGGPTVLTEGGIGTMRQSSPQKRVVHPHVAPDVFTDMGVIIWPPRRGYQIKAVSMRFRRSIQCALNLGLPFGKTSWAL